MAHKDVALGFSDEIMAKETVDEFDKYCALGKSPIDVNMLQKELSCYEHTDRDCLLEGFNFGFYLN